MIHAMIFDLDGTLVQTEKLKALSYARAAVELRPGEVKEGDVIEAFKEVVGLERQEAARILGERFELEKAVRPMMEALGLSDPWQAFVELRQRRYQEMIADPAVIRRHQWPHNIALLKEARRLCCKIGLATMSYRREVDRVLEILHLTRAFDVIASREDVEHGKPDPSIYRLVAQRLAVAPAECLVIEDSLNGVKAALGAGMRCLAVSTPFTREGLHRETILDDRWIVDDPSDLRDVLRQLFKESERQG